MSVRLTYSLSASQVFSNNRGFPKTSAFGKATLNLWEKAGFRPLFQERFPKPTGFWEMLNLQAILC
jgi:hypothetical protein